MSALRLSLCFAPLLLLVTPACHQARPDVAPAAQVDRGHLEASLDQAIALLAAGQHRAFILEFMAPADLANLEQEGGLDAVLPAFSQDKAPRLLAHLRQARATTPQRDGDRATYLLPGERPLTLQLTQGRWTLRN